MNSTVLLTDLQLCNCVGLGQWRINGKRRGKYTSSQQKNKNSNWSVPGNPILNRNTVLKFLASLATFCNAGCLIRLLAALGKTNGSAKFHCNS